MERYFSGNEEIKKQVEYKVKENEATGNRFFYGSIGDKFEVTYYLHLK